MEMVRICMTGGPCGGKSSAIEVLRREAVIPWPVLAIPEPAKILSASGIRVPVDRFQIMVVKLQRAIEDIASDARPAVHLCHRGTLDALAYWVRAGLSAERFFDSIESSAEIEYRRYYAVIHVESVAIGCPEAYRRWPAIPRLEDTEAAAALDKACRRIWENHPRFYDVQNVGRSWMEKLDIILDIVRELFSSFRIEESPCA